MSLAKLKPSYQMSDELSEVLYREASEKAAAAVTAYELRHAATLFFRIKKYRDAEEKALQLFALSGETGKTQRKSQLKITAIILSALTICVVVFIIVVPFVEYDRAMELMNTGSYTEAAEIFADMESFRDSRERALECRYQNAEVLFAGGDLIEAVRAYARLGVYKDSREKTRTYQLEALLGASLHDVVVYGEYITGALEWRIIDIDGDVVTLIAENPTSTFDKYNERGYGVTWETSTMREMLNSSFLRNFNEVGASRILPTTLSNPDNLEYGVDAGSETVDYVYLLSFKEAEEYFKTDEQRASMYSGSTSWWLRTPGENARRAAFVHVNGAIHLEGTNVDRMRIATRPVIRISTAG